MIMCGARFRFSTPKYETFFKDDANHDPQWTEEQILSAGFVFNGVKIGKLLRVDELFFWGNWVDKVFTKRILKTSITCIFFWDDVNILLRDGPLLVVIHQYNYIPQ